MCLTVKFKKFCEKLLLCLSVFFVVFFSVNIFGNCVEMSGYEVLKSGKLKDLSDCFKIQEDKKDVIFDKSVIQDKKSNEQKDIVKRDLQKIYSSDIDETAKYDLAKAIFNAYENDSSMTIFLASQSVKPDIAGGIIIVKPAIPYVNKFLGMAVVFIIVGYGLSTVLDIAYITNPLLRVRRNKGGVHQGGAYATTSDKPWFISEEAQYAVNSNTMSIGQGQTGGKFKSPIVTYFSARAYAYVFVGLAVALLIGGDFYSISVLLVNLAEGIKSMLF